MKKEKIKNLSNISFISLLFGFIMLFIKWPIGILFLIVYLFITPYLLIKYPKEMQDIRNSIIENAQKKQNEIKNVMPDYNFKTFNIQHISGIEYAKKGEKCELSILNNEISFYDSKDDFISCFKYDDLKKCNIYQEIEQEYKDKSPVIRTIVGGVLLGPVGAVVGGVSGITPTVKNKDVFYIEFEFKDSDIMENIIISGDFNTLKQIKHNIKGENEFK